MKRKFSFNLAPVKLPSKSDSHANTNAKPPPPEPTPSHAPPVAHRRHQSKDSITTLTSPFISRRPLSPRTEQELRAACALILQNFKSSDHDFAEDAKPWLDYQGLNRRREPRNGPAQVRVHKPTGAPAEPRSVHDARKLGQRPEAAVKNHDIPMQANTGRRRIEHTEAADKEQETRRNFKSASVDHPRSVTMRTEMDSDDGTSLKTPLTSSTDNHLNNGSTAPTSAAVTSGRSSKRASHQLDNAATIADAQAADWMRQELEKRRQQLVSQPQPQPESQEPTRSLSRTKSIRSEIKEYIFPGSVNLSRTQSRESTQSHASTRQEPRRSGSSHGWRSWGLQRKLSSRSNSRPVTSKGRIESQEQDRKPELNLNRELPPLPSLDSWKQEEQPKTKDNRKSQAQGAHIATVMRPQDQQQQQYAAAVRRHHRKSGSETLAIRYADSTYPQISSQIANVPAQLVIMPKRTAPRDTSMNFDGMFAMDSSSKNLNDRLALGINGHAYHRSVDNLSRSPSMNMGSDHYHLDAPPNFSRKISTDVASAQRTYDHDFAYPNMVQIASHKQGDEQTSRLKKMLSGWMLRKDKKDNWMDQFEKNGIKGGVMIQDEAALPPVVRY